MAIKKQISSSSSNLIEGKVIGKGSYGVVRLGFRRDTGEILAVKTAEKNLINSIEAINNEISVLRTLSSPYIVEYYGEEETTSCKKLLMEYLPKGDVARGGKVDDVEVIRRYTWCLVKALMECHRKGVVHCDVKASNVLFGSGQDVVKLADFGSAKRVGGVKSVGFCGSPLWMAPEVVRGESQGFEADIWSLGCTVIEFFSGLPGWNFDDVHSGLFKIGYSDSLPEYPDRVTELGRDFLGKCLVRDIGQRWRCDQLLEHPFLLPVPTQNLICDGRYPSRACERSLTCDGNSPSQARLAVVPNVKVLEPSPRSILDWAHHIGLDDENDDEDEDKDWKFGDGVGSGKGRIAELVTEVGGVNWESDGWVEVRRLSLPGVNLEIEDCDYYPTWINLCEEINEVEISGGDDGGDGDLLCRQNINDVIKESLLSSLMMLFRLYSCKKIGQSIVTMILLMKLLIRLTRFWFKSVLLVFSVLILFLLFILKNVNPSQLKDKFKQIVDIPVSLKDRFSNIKASYIDS